MKEGEIDFYSEALFDKETHYYCEKTKGYQKNNTYFPITTIYRYFETFDYYFGLETYYKWKKNLVLLADEISKSHNRKPFKIIDFSVYHYFTSEMVPLKPEIAMQYYWESSHYKKELGDIVLDRLLDISPYKDFGIELNSQNIDNHIQKLRDDREKYIDIKKYRQEVFGEN